MDPPKAKCFRCALVIADRIPCGVLGQKQKVSDHLTLQLTAQQADLGARLNFQANRHPGSGLVLSEQESKTDNQTHQHGNPW